MGLHMRPFVCLLTQKVPIDADVDIAAATKLQRDGYVTISMLPTAEARAAQRVAFTDSFLTFPEYLRDPADATRTPSGQPLVYVAGGFGALANPGSFHCDNAREIRECILAAVISLLGAYARLPMIAEWLAKLPTHAAVQLRKVAVFMERNSVRSAGTSVSADSVHFDSSPKGVLRTGDVVFGCVLNVNEDSIVSAFIALSFPFLSFFAVSFFLFRCTCSRFGACRVHTLQ